jgi:hypothetical protein
VNEQFVENCSNKFFQLHPHIDSSHFKQKKSFNLNFDYNIAGKKNIFIVRIPQFKWDFTQRKSTLLCDPNLYIILVCLYVCIFVQTKERAN